jgi:hypothetical protein
MVIKSVFACNSVKKVFDEYYTRKKAWEDIQGFIPSEKVLYEAFMLNSLSSSPLYLQELGFKVEWNTSHDFFQQEKRENALVVSNSPLSLKKEVLQHLKQIDQPFISIISSTVLNTKYFLETFGNDKRIQLIIYLCWQIGLEFDINFIK